MLKPGDTLLDGRYLVEALVGQGAFAQVFRARDTRLNRTVALKTLSRNLPGIAGAEISSYRRRFEMEAQLGAGHESDPHLIQVYDWFEDDEWLVLVMAYAPGGSLADQVKRQGALPWRDVVQHLRACALGLRKLHEDMAVIHRDLKPSNILIDASGRARIADLGLAQVDVTDFSRRSTLGSEAGPNPGTPSYRSPEHGSWEPLGPTSDIYSLGCVAFELLTGQPWKAVRHKVTRVRDLSADVPRWLDAIVMRMLCESPGLYASDNSDTTKRYVDADSVLVDLDRGARQKPVLRRFVVPALLLLTAGSTLLIGRPLLDGLRSPTQIVMTLAAPAQTPVPAAHTLTPTVAPTEASTPDATPEQTATARPTLTATTTATQSPTSEPTATLVPEPTLGVGSTRTRAVDGMVQVYVPTGEFRMGSTNEGEGPIHTVVLDGFWLDRTEVTVAQFRGFVAATGHQTAAERQGKSWVFTTHWAEVSGANWERPIGPQSVAQDDHPVVHVSWHDAGAYCRWVGGRLPTEAEWEYSARGPAGLAYPWGSEFDSTRVNMCDVNCAAPWATRSENDGYPTTAPVGSFPEGASWVGALDMTGNVWEWVQDWYGPYPSGREINPTGPQSGERRVLRGGSWYDPLDGQRGRGADRNSGEPSVTNVNNGFRCVSIAAGNAE